MSCCSKCGKSEVELFTTSYGDVRCEDCWDDHLMTDKGKVEYLISICNGEAPMSDYDADFLCCVNYCWYKYRADLNLTLAQINDIESKAKEIGLL